MRNIITTCLLLFPVIAVAQDELVFVEAESFANKGGWVVDQQFIDIMGSSVLMAHGMGKPVADADTEVVFPRPGEYWVFIRTRNWVAPWTTEHAPGQFQLSVDGKKLDTIFGTEGNAWHWQRGGTVTINPHPNPLPEGEGITAKLALHDLTGFNGRLDAIIFTTDRNFTPPEDIGEIDKIRRKTLGLTEKATDAPAAKEGPFDFVVVGGGIAGMCSAISAARLGCKVALIHDRPVLGGNNSSEVRVHLQGRMGYPPYPNLGNLVHELDPLMDGNAQTGDKYDDAKKFAIIAAEENLTLYHSTRMIAVETKTNADGSITIKSVIGKHIGTGEETKFIANMFADCTGDANLGFLASAEWRMGRESKAETGESTAPETADKLTMGASVQWYSVPATDAHGATVKTEFSPVPWAFQFTHESARPALDGEWDWETGMNFDKIWDFERIRDNGLRAAFGHWAYMKNQSEPQWRERAESRELGWVAYIAGKRESRRLMGDIVLKEQDIVQQEIFPDASVVTTWTIDLHYPEARNAQFFPGEEFRAIAVHQRIQPYAIPYRCFYSKNVTNMFMAGRNISVTHVALGTIRVMRTTGMMGEVVGMAASLCKEHDITPRGVYEKHLDELKFLMEKGVAPQVDQYWHTARPNLPAVPPTWLPQAGKNFTLDASITVSSTRAEGGYHARYINDGRFNFNDNAGRWVSATTPDGEPVEHWVELRFDEPMAINAVRFLTGQAGPITPIRDFVFQRRVGGQWIDIPGTKTEGNTTADVSKRFDTVTSDTYRLFITATPGNLARIWELELYRVAE
ncbi:MAG: FAD-dependent oxidoreductase [Planctomycetaceae bacterium]|nr:FAD-dependent oxidoreductase [Planctomycetaceae bacterium]